MRRLSALCGTILLVSGVATTTILAQTPEPGSTLQQEGFTPIDQLPPQDQLPAAPLLIAAYVFVVVVLFVYLFSVSRRLTGVQHQIERLEGDIGRSKKG
jgi:CcmD family protein